MGKVEKEIEGVTHSSSHVAAGDFEEQSRVDLTRCVSEDNLYEL
jgi:hypothetical protein